MRSALSSSFQALGAAQLPAHQQGALASLLSQQLQAPHMQEAQLPAVDSAYLAAMPQGWPGNPTVRPMSPLPGAAGAVSPPAMAELQAGPRHILSTAYILIPEMVILKYWSHCVSTLG